VVEGLIFDNIHVIDNIPDTAEMLGYGVDFGFTNDPTAIVSPWKDDEGIYFDEIMYDKGLLQELMAYNSTGNYDRVSALGMLMILKEDRYKYIDGYTDEEEKQPDMFDTHWENVSYKTDQESMF
jgi:hypothetical protein